MTLEQYGAIMVKQWKTILICFVVVGLGTYIASKFITPVYQSTSLVQVTIRSLNSQSDINSLLASDQLVQTEAQLATSDPVLREVASHYPGLSVDQLSKEVTTTPKLNTQLFEIDVLDSSPTRAANLANDITSTLIKQQLQVTQQNNQESQQQIQQDLKETRQQIDATATQIAALSAQKGKQSQIAVLQAQLSSLQQHYSQWQTALAQLELTEAQSGDFLRIAQTAQPALHPVRPNILLNTGAGLVAGLLLGILLAVLFEKLDTRVRTGEAVSQLLGWPTLATIWLARASKKEDVIHPKGHTPSVESYRILRTNIGFSAIDKPLRSLIVTSALPREGKSVIAANLAIFMAKAGKNTLLIDADLRRPTVHEKFGLSFDKKGLSNAVLACSTPTTTGSFARRQSLEPCLGDRYPTSPARPPSSVFRETALSRGQGDRKGSPLPRYEGEDFSIEPFIYSAGMPNLWVMPSGPLPPNPSELLDSKAMQRFLEALEQSGVEVVIFDTPPLLGLSDTSILAPKVDGVLVVADITQANKKNLKQVQGLLTQAGANILGCVVNKQHRKGKDTAHSYYYHTDEQNGEDSQGKKNGNIK